MKCFAEHNKLYTLLVQTQCYEAQAAEGFRGGSGKEKSKMFSRSWRDVAQRVDGLLVGNK
jgi:hypothetical protein